MKVRDFMYVVFLMVIAAILLFLVTPKFYFHAPARSIIRGNRITGTLEIYTGDGWQRLGPNGPVKEGGGHD